MKKTVGVGIVLFLLAIVFLTAIFLANPDKYEEEAIAETPHQEESLETFIISPNLPTRYEREDIPAGAYYVIYRNVPELLDIRFRMRPADLTPTAFVGDETTIDLTNYLDKPVLLKGNFQEGHVMRTNSEVEDCPLFGEDKTVFLIDEVRLVP